MPGGFAFKVLFICIIVISLFLLLRFFERKNLYFPMRNIEATPGAIGLEYEDVRLMTEDGVRLAGWFIPSESPRATVIFCHGNGGNISHRLEKIAILNSLHLDILIFDYRGYGESGGSPSEDGLYLDAEAAYDFLIRHKKTAPGGIIVFGESLGGAVAAELAVRHDVGGIIIESCFTSVRDMAKRFFPFIPSFVIKSRFDTLEKIKNVSAPKLILHSRDDEIVPFDFGSEIFKAAQDPKEFVELRGGHNDAFLVSRIVFTEGLDSFIGRY
jgi:fermentation-respiration switch protein FrsA (DUF1100 family)